MFIRRGLITLFMVHSDSVVLRGHLKNKAHLCVLTWRVREDDIVKWKKTQSSVKTKISAQMLVYA